MAFLFNPITGNLDLVDKGGKFWLDPVATFASLPASDPDGACRVVLDVNRVYQFDFGTTTWSDIGGISLSTVGSSPNANAATLSGGALNLEPASGSFPGVVSTTTQTFAGNKTFSGTVSASNLSGTNSGDVTLSAVGASPNANAASLSGQAITLQPADGSNPGVITSGTQTLGGNKTFTGTVSASNISGTNTGDITLAAFGSFPNANGASLSGQALTLQPASASNPGGVSTSSQTFAGIKSFSSQINADGGIDLSSAGTLSIGTTVNSTTINIGNSGATVNIQGTTLYENVSQLQVVDPLITLNKGGGSGSAQDSGLELEEASSITGYAKTSLDRNSWRLKAPNTAGDALITPGAGGIVLNQSSHDPVTLAAVGSAPNANAASLSSQALTLQPADGSNPGVVSTTTQTFAGNKTFSGTISASNFSGSSSGTNTGDQTSVSGNAGSATLVATTAVSTNASFYPLFVSSSTNSNQAVSLDASGFTYNPSTNNLTATTFTGALVGNADTATTTTNFTGLLGGDVAGAQDATVVLSVGGKTASQVATSVNDTIAATNLNTASTIVKRDASGNFSAGTISAALSGIASGNLLKITGDLDPASFTFLDNQAAAVDVTGLSFANANTRAFEALVSIVRSTNYESYKLHGIQKSALWEMSQTSVGDSTGVIFSITAAGQVQYTSTNTGFGGTIRYRSTTLAV